MEEEVKEEEVVETTTEEPTEYAVEEESKTVTINKTGNKDTIITIVLMIVFFLAIVLVGILSEKQSDEVEEETTTKTTETTEESTTVPRESNKVVTIFKIEKSYTSGDKEVTYYSYYNQIPTNEEYKSASLVGRVECNDVCQYIEAVDNYVLVKENNAYSIYDYVNNNLIVNNLGDAAKDNGKYSKAAWFYPKYNNAAQAVVYHSNPDEYSEYKIFSLLSGTLSESFVGSDACEGAYEDPCEDYIYEQNYYLNSVYEQNKIEVFDLKTNKIKFTMKGEWVITIGNDNKQYILAEAWDKKAEKYVIYVYDLNGRQMLNGEEINQAYLANNNIAVEKDGKFYLYDINLNKIKEGKKYTDIIMFGSDFILVQDNANLKLLNYDEEELATFLTDYSKDKYDVHTFLSGWYKDEKIGKDGIYVVVEYKEEDAIKKIMEENKNDEDIVIGCQQNGCGYEYYYIPSTGETGKIPTWIGGYAKPVLYLYPKEEIKVNIRFKYSNNLTTTYPKYINSWNMLVKPNGDMYDESGRYYYALYWEEEKNHDISFNEGFYVESDNAIEFLEEKLTLIGLNEREQNEFIMYWLPILESNEKSLVYFELTEERDYYSPLIINPKPDSILRISMHVKKVNKKTKIKEQKLTSFERNGFVAVEWGGVIH